uniref:Uncharacterized protein n=1 Tax=Aegilops tauschii subsp. strangulata TaxID=200361 RepID=A0A453J808_AEGTS
MPPLVELLEQPLACGVVDWPRTGVHRANPHSDPGGVLLNIVLCRRCSRT